MFVLIFLYVSELTELMTMYVYSNFKFIKHFTAAKKLAKCPVKWPEIDHQAA